MNEIIDISFSNEDTTEPVTLQEAKDWMRIDSTDDDDIITSLITSARQAVEDYTSCSLVEKDIVCVACVDDVFELPHGPVIGEVTTVTTDNDEAFTGFLEYPGAFKKLYNAIGDFTFSYTVGYDPVPEKLKLAILNEVAYRYNNRGDQVKGVTLGSSFLCEAAANLCQSYKRMSWL